MLVKPPNVVIGRDIAFNVVWMFWVVFVNAELGYSSYASLQNLENTFANDFDKFFVAEEYSCLQKA